ncbi:sugar ABC transporter substrate-binding protein [Yinghuangia sp. ASG 101]|uniref:sugar ABC transporter substrate-binding protein n=1 Tax=Yinghuangia sp. ASG 101 TaxID=2896848 RepID=UPI001E579A3F|nr:sugar ABC transporter substrate-binding protein [Yinghuangia sp. ASG 101]UGQ12971.1 sugar ABC transporter substrate-binding protein [Yinghuangia sp. ASG 101]
MKLGRRLTAAGTTVLLFALAACGSDSDSGSSGGGLDLGYAAPVAAQTGQQQMTKGMKDAVATMGGKVTVYDSNLSSSKQVTNMQTMIQKKHDVIGSWTLDPGATAGIYDQVKSRGIPLVGVNSDDSGIEHSVWYSMQRCTPGGPAERTAALFAKARPGGSVLTIGLDGVPSIDNNIKCFTEAAEKAGLTVIAHVSNTTDDSAGGQKLTADLLTKHPDVDAIFSYNDTSALGASAAVTAGGKKVSDGTSDGILITGANGDADAVQAVREGRLTGTWDPNNTEFGWLLIKMAQALQAGDAPTRMVLESTFVDAESVKEYIEPAQRTITFETLKFTSE